MDEQPRLDANANEHNYLLSVEEAADRYAAAGHPRTIRAIQKYCGRGDLESQKVETTYGERYLITPASVDRHIAMIIERARASGHAMSRMNAVDREQTRTDAPSYEVAPQDAQPDTVSQEPPPVREQARTDAGVDERYVRAIERENDFLRDQILTKDTQIKELAERNKETNVLVGSLHRLLSPLLGTGNKTHSPDPLRPIESQHD